jgi:hypothetical protein
MAVIALVSAKGSPGVTTAALALTLTWPAPALLAECDPAGGSVQAGFLAGTMPTGRGIGELAVAGLRGERLNSLWWHQLVDLDTSSPRTRLLLPGIADPVQSATLAPVWDRLAKLFADLGDGDPGRDVIADCGRLTAPHPPWPLFGDADAVLLVLPATLPGLHAAVPAVRLLRARLAEHDRGFARLGLLLCGRANQSSRTVTEVLNTPVVAGLPEDVHTARVLTHGGRLRRRSALLQAAGWAHRPIISHINTRKASPSISRAGTVRR